MENNDLGYEDLKQLEKGTMVWDREGDRAEVQADGSIIYQDLEARPGDDIWLPNTLCKVYEPYRLTPPPVPVEDVV